MRLCHLNYRSRCITSALALGIAYDSQIETAQFQPPRSHSDTEDVDNGVLCRTTSPGRCARWPHMSPPFTPGPGDCEPDYQCAVRTRGSYRCRGTVLFVEAAPLFRFRPAWLHKAAAPSCRQPRSILICSPKHTSSLGRSYPALSKLCWRPLISPAVLPFVLLPHRAHRSCVGLPLLSSSPRWPPLRLVSILPSVSKQSVF